MKVTLCFEAPLQGQENRPVLKGAFSGDFLACEFLDEHYVPAHQRPEDTQFLHVETDLNSRDFDTLLLCQAHLGAKDRLVNGSLWVIQSTAFPYRNVSMVWFEEWEVASTLDD